MAIISLVVSLISLLLSFWSLTSSYTISLITRVYECIRTGNEISARSRVRVAQLKNQIAKWDEFLAFMVTKDAAKPDKLLSEVKSNKELLSVSLDYLEKTNQNYSTVEGDFEGLLNVKPIAITTMLYNVRITRLLEKSKTTHLDVNRIIDNVDSMVENAKNIDAKIEGIMAQLK